MKKHSYKKYVATGFALVAALGLTLAPAISFALDVTAPVTAADGKIGLVLSAPVQACNGATNALTMNNGVFGCNSISAGTGDVTAVNGTTNQIVSTSSTGPVPALSLAPELRWTNANGDISTEVFNDKDWKLTSGNAGTTSFTWIAMDGDTDNENLTVGLTKASNGITAFMQFLYSGTTTFASLTASQFDIDAPIVDLGTQATTIKLKDNEASALVIENATGGVDLIKLTTTNSGETITLGDASLSTTNILGTWQLGSTEITATATELNYVDGVSSAIQTQLDAKLPSLISFTTETKIDADDTDLYIGIDGSVSTVENEVAIPVASDSTFSNLRCRTSVATGTGTGITATLGEGTCGSALNYTSKLTSGAVKVITTVSGSGTTAADNTDCVAFKVNVNTANAAFFSCSFERS